MSAIKLAEPLAHEFTPVEAPATLDVAVPVFDKLDALPLETSDDLYAFLDALNETRCWIADYVSKTRVATSVHTDDAEAQKAWATLVTTVLPERARRENALARKLLDSSLIEELEGTEYASFLRQLRVEVELYRDENVELEKQEETFRNEYQQISGGWTIEFDGEERTLSQMRRFLSAKDRDTRRSAWLAISNEVSRTANSMEEIFEQLFELRTQIAKNAGFDSYRDYVFVEKLRDYQPEDCLAFAQLVEEEVLPLVEELADDLTTRLELDCFRPWDANAQPDGGEALEPFEDGEELKDGVERMMMRLDEGLGQRFAQIRTNMDLESRANKRQGGFMTWFSWDKRPFIFANAAGTHDDIMTLLHEAGHAFHGLLSDEAKSRPMANVGTPMEFNEVASMAMELLHYDTLDEFYDETDRKRAITQHLRRIPRLFSAIARGDLFQHWLYTNPSHTREERRAKYLELDQKYAPHVDYSGIEVEDLKNSYHMVLHFFVVPFYYIEYGFAQFGALQLAMNAERDLEGTMEKYKYALSLGPQRDVKSLFEAAGIEFVPTRETVREAMDWIRERLAD